MTIRLELPPDVEARFRAEAQTRGVPIDTLVEEYLIRNVPQRQPAEMSAEEWDLALDDLASLIPPNVPALSDEAMSRESIYTREDTW